VPPVVTKIACRSLDPGGQRGADDENRLAALAYDVERHLEEARAGSPKPVEAPSPAELAVLRLLATDLSQREIGNELFLSMNTVKTHTRNHRIVVEGELGSRYAAAFEPMQLVAHDGATEIVGRVKDDAELQGLIDTVAALGLSLVSVTPVK
jgi:hypothetical protein